MLDNSTITLRILAHGTYQAVKQGAPKAGSPTLYRHRNLQTLRKLGQFGPVLFVERDAAG
jgi:hypothetical protein